MIPLDTGAMWAYLRAGVFCLGRGYILRSRSARVDGLPSQADTLSGAFSFLR